MPGIREVAEMPFTLDAPCEFKWEMIDSILFSVRWNRLTSTAAPVSSERVTISAGTRAAEFPFTLITGFFANVICAAAALAAWFAVGRECSDSR